MRKPLDRSDRGFTMVELLVSMMIFSICIVMVTSALILVVRKYNDVQKTADAESTLRLAVAQIDRQVRSGNVLYTPAGETTTGCTGDAATNSGTCMRIYTQANGVQKCVQWQVLDDTAHPGTKLLRSRSWDPAWTTTGDVSAWGVVAHGLKLDSTNPFRLEGASTPYKERLLDVRLLALDSRTGRTITVQESLSGRNTSYGYSGTDCTPVPPA
ncbi:MAG TPA: type II secretion system protein [Candidatus Limnocylindrales bacterium]